MAAAAAAVLFVAGFATLAGLSATGQWTAGRSMWHYRSATWGDALLVPVMGAALAAALSDKALGRAPNERWGAVTGAVACGLAGVLVQASWLASSKPIPNWTLPEAHRFSLPGWYHAVFLVGASTAIGGAALLVARRIRQSPDRARAALIRHPVVPVVAGAVIAFGALLGMDSADSTNTSAGVGSSVAALTAAAAFMVLAAYAFGARGALRLALTGALWAALIVAGSVLTHGLP